jgi:hypothetical protein
LSRPLDKGKSIYFQTLEEQGEEREVEGEEEG